MKEGLKHLTLFLCTGIVCITALFISDKLIIEPQDNFYEFDNLRVHKDSEYVVNAYFKENGQVDCYVIKFYYNGVEKRVECADYGGATADEWLESYLLPFKGEF